jgi:tRNA nucleotidyltransferase (CCA-adding enzyme)
MMNWSHFPHGADIGLRGMGATKAQAFEAIGLALTAVVTEPERVNARESVEITCEAPDDELLLLDWLNALVFEMAVRRMLFREFSVEISRGHLRAEIRGEPVDPQKHEPAVEVKGATCTELAAEETDKGWLVQCVVDV